MLVLLISLACFTVGYADSDDLLIRFPTILYVHPGDDFELQCKSTQSSSIKIFAPEEIIPNMEQAADMNKGFSESAERTTTINEYENASVEDAGIYTCLVMHGPDAEQDVSIATCQVIIVDLCGELNCEAPEECVSDYTTGEANCVCPKDMCDDYVRIFEPMCSDTCETFFNDCHLKETSCMDKKIRNKAYDGMCRTTVIPTVNQLKEQQPVDILLGDSITLSAGVVADGDPLASIVWTFTPEGGVAEEIPNVRDALVLNAIDVAQSGVYSASISHCASPLISNSYKVSITEPIYSTYGPGPIFTSTPEDSGPAPLTNGIFPVCSFYNDGVFEMFSGASKRLGFSCNHVMAADVYPEGNEANPWFVYGTFEVNGGNPSLRAMTFYVGRQVFEVQRGWVVNLGGEKFLLEEDVERVVGESGCSVLFSNLHLEVNCGSFSAYYDGFMNGHIRLLKRLEDPVVPTGTQMGLCFGTPSGRRVNWQVGLRDGFCKVQDLPDTCTFEEPTCSTLELPSIIQGLAAPFGQCGVGATASCDQLYCNDDQTADEVCAFKRANALNCALKYQTPTDATASIRYQENCDEGCDWKEGIVARGCPQESPPFNCP